MDDQLIDQLIVRLTPLLLLKRAMEKPKFVATALMLPWLVTFSRPSPSTMRVVTYWAPPEDRAPKPPTMKPTIRSPEAAPAPSVSKTNAEPRAVPAQAPEKARLNPVSSQNSDLTTTTNEVSGSSNTSADRRIAKKSPASSKAARLPRSAENDQQYGGLLQ